MIDDAVGQLAKWRAQGLILRTSVNVSVRDLHRPEFVDQLAEAARRPRSPAEPDPAGDHRGRADGRPAPGPGDPAPAGQARRRAVAGRLRHGLLVAAAPAAAAAGRGEDRPVVRARHGRPTPTTPRWSARSSTSPGRSACAWWPRASRTTDTRRLLVAGGCEVGQGWFFARPMPADAFGTWLARYRPVARSQLPSALPDAR